MAQSVKSTITFGLLLLVPATATSQDIVKDLTGYCQKHQPDALIKGSDACRLVEGKINLKELCELAARPNDNRNKMRVDRIAEQYAEVTGANVDVAKEKICADFTGKDVIASKPECKAETDGSSTISRTWWNGQAWVATTENLEAIKKSADKGDSWSQFNLGNWFIKGAPCIAADKKVGVRHLCRAYDQGFQMAAMQLQSMTNAPSAQKARESLGKEYGCELTDRQKAYAAETEKLKKLAEANLKKAEAGDVAAMVKVAMVYQSTEDGFDQDFKKAFFWAEKAAKKGNVTAMSIVGALYGRGDGVEENDEKAFEWSLKAAQKGDVDSMYSTGLYYYDGTGVDQDHSKAVHWLSKAWDHGHQEAGQHLSEMYAKGELQAVAFKSLVQRLKVLERKK